MLKMILIDDDLYCETMNIKKSNRLSLEKRMLAPLELDKIICEALVDWNKKNRKEYVNGL